MQNLTNQYRPNVAALIRKDDMFLACQRSDHPKNWQCPQGGIDPGEAAQIALWRELSEETSLGQDDLGMIAMHRSLLRYDFPPGVSRDGAIGQEQQWFLLDFLGDESDIVLGTSEFQDWKWMTLGELVEKAVPFKRQTVEAVKAWVESL